MKYLATLLLILGFGLSAFGQTIKSLGYNATNGQVVANTGTNVLKFTNNITLDAGEGGMQFRILGDGVAIFSGAAGEDILTIPADDYPLFAGPYWSDPTIRQSFGFSTNLNTLWTATNTIAARQALGLQSYTNSLTNSVGDVEIGSTVNSVTIGWTISPTNATYALRQLVGAGQTNTITNNSSTLALTSLGLTNATTWTLTVGDGSGVTNTVTTSVNFYNYMTWGRSTNTSLNNAQIQSLHTSGGGASRALSTSRSRSITMDGGGQYLYIAYPQGFGAASFVVGGLPNSAFTAFTNSYTNANGYVTNYLIYRTDTIQNGTGINIVIQ